MARYMPAKVLDLNQQPHGVKTVLDKMNDIFKPSAAHTVRKEKIISILNNPELEECSHHCIDFEPRFSPIVVSPQILGLFAEDISKQRLIVQLTSAFFTALRSNLLLPPSDSTHASMSASIGYELAADLDDRVSHPQLFTSPSLLSPQKVTPSTLDSIPPLTTAVTNSASAKTDALKLIADSIAQQRQTASRALITHPVILGSYALLMATLTKFFYHTSSDLGLLVTTAAGVSMACLIAVRFACQGYITAAEEIDLSYLDPIRGEDILITSTFGTEVIGALVLQIQSTNFKASAPSSPSKKAKRSHQSHRHNHKGGKALIRAWTTSLRYRRKGVGSCLLEEAVKVARERLGKDAELGFAVEHANSLHVLPDMFNGMMIRGEQQAGRMLEEIVTRVDSSRKRRR